MKKKIIFTVSGIVLVVLFCIYFRSQLLNFYYEFAVKHLSQKGEYKVQNIDNKANVKVFKIGDMKYSRVKPQIVRIYSNLSSSEEDPDIDYSLIKNKVVIMGNKNIYQNPNNAGIRYGEIFDINKKSSILIAKSNFDNNNNYIFYYGREDKIANIQPYIEKNNDEYGIEIYDIQTNTMKFLKTKPVKRNYDNCKTSFFFPDDPNGWLLISGGTYYKTNKPVENLEILDIIKDKKIENTINPEVIAGGMRNYYSSKRQYLLFGGINKKSNLPSKDIILIDLKNNTIKKIGEMTHPQVLPEIHRIRRWNLWNDIPDDYISIETCQNQKESINLINTETFKSTSIKFPKILNGYKVIGSIPNLTDRGPYIFFAKGENIYITKYNLQFNSIDILAKYVSFCENPSYNYVLKKKNSKIYRILFAGGIKRNGSRACSDVGLIEIKEK